MIRQSKYLFLGVGLCFAALPATAQVMVIGGGLGLECYQSTLHASSNMRLAERTCTRALQQENMNRTNRAATYTNRGVLHMRMANYDAALRDYANAQQISPDLGPAYLNQGAAYIYTQQYDRAQTALTRAIELQSQDIHAAYYNRGIANEHLGNLMGAYDDFNKALELSPGWDKAEMQLARFTVTEE